jgi:hypothetical protein
MQRQKRRNHTSNRRNIRSLVAPTDGVAAGAKTAGAKTAGVAVGGKGLRIQGWRKVTTKLYLDSFLWRHDRHLCGLVEGRGEAPTSRSHGMKAALSEAAPVSQRVISMIMERLIKIPCRWRNGGWLKRAVLSKVPDALLIPARSSLHQPPTYHKFDPLGFQHLQYFYFCLLFPSVMGTLKTCCLARRINYPAPRGKSIAQRESLRLRG